AQRQSLRLAALALLQPQHLPHRALLLALSRLRLQPLRYRFLPRAALLRPALLDRRSLAVSPAAGRAGHRMGALLQRRAARGRLHRRGARRDLRLLLVESPSEGNEGPGRESAPGFFLV